MRGGRAVGLAMAVAACAPAAVGAQGWIEPGVVRGGFAVDKVQSEVRIRVEGNVALLEVSEWFRNNGRSLAEGQYFYPLPGEAVFQGFSLFQGEREIRGEIMDASQARSVYEGIVRRRADPALVELVGQGLLRARVFPIAPGEERKVTLRYTELLSRAGDALELAYAGGVRGGPGPARSEAFEGRHVPVHESASFEVVAEDGDRFLDPFSPTHTLEVHREGRRLRIRVADEVVGRLSLFLPLAQGGIGLALATYRAPGEDGYFMLTLSPGRATGRVAPRDVTVVLDVSGSMSGEKLDQAKAALRGLLATLSGDDRFRLVSFSNAVHVLSDDWEPATGVALTRARAWVDDLVADGGTNIGEALDEAFRLPSPEGRLPVVLFVTDGLPTVGEQSP
jgi:Ca-activated chloride channel homolog